MRVGPRTLMLFGLLVVVSTGCGDADPDAPGDGPPNVVLVSIDSLRADHVGVYGYERDTTPFIDSLAAEGVVFRNAVSTTSWTLPAHAALFTGLLDSTHGVVDNGLELSDAHTTLAEVMRDRGMETAGFYGGPYLHPTFGLGQGFDVYESTMGVGEPEGKRARVQAQTPRAISHRDITGPRTRAAVRRWAAAREPRPFFLFIHLWDVHYDYLPPPEYAARFTDPDYAGPADGRLMANHAIAKGMAEADLAHVIGLYDAEIRSTDDILKGIVEDLTAAGMMGDTLLIVTADHGEEFLDHGAKGHNKTLFDEVLRVPLVARWPGRIPAGTVVDDQVQLIDILPTIGSAIGVAPLPPNQGRDLAPLWQGSAEAPRPALAELMIDGQTQRALRTNEQKAMVARKGASVFVFDLLTNPEEDVRGVIADHQRDPEGTAARARVAAEALAAAYQGALRFRDRLGRIDPERADYSPELADELRALGYLEDGGSDADVPE